MSKNFCKRIQSPLFEQIKNRVGDYTTAVEMYTMTQSKTFKETFGDKLIYDANNEPTIESLESILQFDNNSDILKKIEKQEKLLNYQVPSNNIDVVARAVKFNKEHSDMYAKIVDLDKFTSKFIVQKRTKENEYEVQQLERSLKTYQQIDRFLNQMGIDIKILDPSYFNKEDALIIPQNFNTIVNGVFGVINIANNYAGFKALPEEFGHFIIECVKDNQIIQRLETLLNTQPEIIEQILGNEYIDVFNYYKNKNQEHLIAREALGRLLSRSIESNNITLQNVPLWQRGKTLMMNFINTKFRFTNPNELLVLDDIKKALENVATSFTGNIRKHQQILQRFKEYGETLAHTSKQIENDVLPKCEKLLNRIGKFITIYEKEGNDLETINELKLVFNKALTVVLPKNYNDIRQQGIAAMFSNQEEETKLITIEELKKELDSGVFLTKTTSVLRDSIPIIQKCLGQTAQLKHDLIDPSYDDILRFSHDIRRNRDMMLTYRDSVMEIMTTLTSVMYDNTINDKDKRIYEDLTQTSQNIINLIFTQINEIESIAKDLLKHYYSYFFSPDGSDVVEFNGHGLEKNIKMEAATSIAYCLDYTKGDISLISRLVDAAYNSRDLLSGLVNQALKTQLEIVRVRAGEDLEELDSLYQQFKGRDDILFERDENGKTTGWYINKYGINFAKYNKVAKEVYAEIDKDTSLTQKDKERKKFEWRNKHTRQVKQTTYIKNGETNVYEQEGTIDIWIPINDPRWNSNAYASLSKDDQILIDNLLELKHKMDVMNGLTGNFRNWQCIQKMIGSATEAVVNSKGTDKARNIWKHLKRGLHITSDDSTEFGSVNDNEEFEQALNGTPNNYFKNLRERYIKKQSQRLSEEEKTISTLTNFEDEVYKRVPAAYIESISEDISQLSTSIGDTFANYIAASHQYEAMHEIADIMELTMVIAKKRSIEQYDRGSRLVHRTKTSDGTILSENQSLKNPNSNNNQLLRHQIDTLLYSEYKHKTAKLGQLSVAKIVDTVINLTTVSMLGYNPFTAINNIQAGKLQMFIESMNGKYFTVPDWTWADKEFGKLWVDYAKELGSPVKNSKLALLMRMFNAEADWLDELSKREYTAPETVNFVRKFIDPSAALNAGEMLMKWSTLGAMLKHYIMLDANGNETNLYDSLDYIDKTDDKGNVIGKQIVMKSGYTKPDGTEFTFKTRKGSARSDLQKMILTMNVINHRMHGIFNREDLVQMKTYAWGRILMMYRNFMWPFLTKRWKGIAHFRDDVHGLTYNVQTGEFERGFYLTTAVFFMNMLFAPTQEIKEHGFWFDGRASYIFELMGEDQKQDVMRFITEFVSTFVLGLLVIIMHGDWDDEKDQWFMRTHNYFTRRLLQEATFAINPQSMLDIIQSPTPVMGPIQDIKKIFEACYDNHVLISGPYKGDTKFKAAVKRATPIIPNITEFIHFDEADRTNGRFQIYHKYNFFRKINSDEDVEYKKYMQKLKEEEIQRNKEMEEEIANAS